MRENIDYEERTGVSNDISDYVNNSGKLEEIRDQVRQDKLQNSARIQNFKSELLDIMDTKISAEVLKQYVTEPINGVDNMQVLKESDALGKIIENLFDISKEKCDNGEGNAEVMPGVNRLKVGGILNDIVENNKEISPSIRKYLYKLLSDNSELYEQLLNRIGGPFILGANDRGNRGSSGSWGVHMGVDYNMPVGVPVQSIYDGVVLGGIRNNRPFGDKKILEQFPIIKEDGDAGYGNMLIIKHEVEGKTFYSLYGHITNDGLNEGQVVKKGEEIGKVASYENNGHWQPHLHFTILHNLDNKSVLHGYGMNTDFSDMINPMEIYR